MEDGGDVFLLVFAGELGGVVLDAVDTEMLVGEGDGGIALGGDAEEDRLGFGLGLPYHHGDGGLDDAGLLDGDLLEGVAEELGVVETDIGDDRQQGGDDIGAVEPAAHADLDDGDVDLFLGKIVEGESHGHLEEGEVEP